MSPWYWLIVKVLVIFGFGVFLLLPQKAGYYSRYRLPFGLLLLAAAVTLVFEKVYHLSLFSSMLVFTATFILLVLMVLLVWWNWLERK